MYFEKIKELAEKNMTEKGYKLWRGIGSILPKIWDRPTSSTGKYHKNGYGEVPNIDEHVYQMFYATVKILRMFNIEMKTPESDSLIFSVILHDALKYGKLGTRKHTDYTHDKLGADMISENKETFCKIMSEKDFFKMEEAVRFHSGQWSTNAKHTNNFTFKDYNPETLFVHMLDMLSTADCLKTDMDYQERE